MKKAKPIMIQGTMSGAGKSILCAALCRIFVQDGYRTAPFKSQNMSLNSHITPSGAEIGTAQAIQAQAAMIEPEACMNPVLLKPSSDIGSQVIVNGSVYAQMSAAEYYNHKQELFPKVLDAYEALRNRFDIIVIEGAGSPAEINLKEYDIVNMGLAKQIRSPVLLTGDIDRGGVFAQLYGTWALLDEEERRLLAGMIINKFRGDQSILDPGLVTLTQMTNVPVLGVVPYLHVDIDDEDSVTDTFSGNGREKLIDIAVIRFPRISNFTDFAPLSRHPQMSVRYVHFLHQLGDPDLIILPGTKSTVHDLLWMRQNGLEEAVCTLSRKIPVFGICGGYQMLGEYLYDPDGVESGYKTVKGLGLLPVTTVFSKEKITVRTKATVETGIFAGTQLSGYQIHMGHSDVGCDAFIVTDDGMKEGAQEGLVFGTYLHGLFDSGELTDRLYSMLAETKGENKEIAASLSHVDFLETQLDILADAVRQSLDMEKIYRILENENG